MNAPIWTTALPDWETRIVAGESLVPCEPLFKQSAEIALKVFKALKLVDVIGKPEIGQVTRQWVYDFVAAHDGFGHQFWIIDNEADMARITELFAAMPSLYIADGHHRSAAAA